MTLPTLIIAVDRTYVASASGYGT